jgi:predicted PurR-regulated permease PerM
MAIKKPSLHLGHLGIKLGRESVPSAPENLGASGAPLDRAHPFYFGFLAAAGAVIAITMLKAFASASQVFVLIVISLFLAAGLNPAVEFFRRRGLSRKFAVLAVIGCVLVFVGLFAAVVIPPVIKQADGLIRNAPSLINSLKDNPTLAKLNSHYGIIDSIQKKVSASIHNGQFVISAFGGVIGVGKAVLSGAISAFTILILTLYFLSSLPSVTQTAYRFVPLSRRERVSKISDAIIRRIGSFVSGQATVAFIAAIFALILALSLNIPYPQAIALLVFICGCIPLVGHILGITAFTLVALTKSPLTAVVVLVCYIIYIQVENYLIMPRIMRRSLSIPGLVTIIAALVGVSLLGIVGGILAVPIAAAIMLIIEEVVFPRTDQS